MNEGLNDRMIDSMQKNELTTRNLDSVSIAKNTFWILLKKTGTALSKDVPVYWFKSKYYLEAQPGFCSSFTSLLVSITVCGIGHKL